jgi:hypothetical protein
MGHLLPSTLARAGFSAIGGFSDPDFAELRSSWTTVETVIRFFRSPDDYW